MAKGQTRERTFRLVTAGYIKYLEYYYENKADIGVNFFIIIVDHYKTLDHLLSVRSKRVNLFTGTSCKVSASAKERCPPNRGYITNIL